jgi:hypothetical protein
MNLLVCTIVLSAYLLIAGPTGAFVEARKVAGPAVQCGVVGEAEFCERTTCYTVQVNDTCGMVLSDEPAPACDAAYYASFVATFGDSLFILYESPLREANGYPSMREALAWVGSVQSLTECVVSNSTAYTDVGKARKSGGGNDNDEYLLAILIIVIVVVVVALVVAITVLTAVSVYAAIRKWKKSAVTV